MPAREAALNYTGNARPHSGCPRRHELLATSAPTSPQAVQLISHVQHGGQLLRHLRGLRVERHTPQSWLIDHFPCAWQVPLIVRPSGVSGLESRCPGRLAGPQRLRSKMRKYLHSGLVPKSAEMNKANCHLPELSQDLAPEPWFLRGECKVSNRHRPLDGSLPSPT